MYGPSESLDKFVQEDKVEPKERTISRKDLIAEFHAGVLSRKFTSIASFRYKYRLQPHVLDLITKLTVTFKDFINQFIEKAY